MNCVKTVSELAVQHSKRRFPKHSLAKNRIMQGTLVQTSAKTHTGKLGRNQVMSLPGLYFAVDFA